MCNALSFILLSTFLSHAAAMSVSSYEKVRAMAESTSAQRLMARATMDSYFQGLAESLTYLQSGSQTVYLQHRPFLCFHSNVQLTGAMLRGVLDGELTKPELFATTLGKDWKEYQIPSVLFPALLRLYPCPK